MRAIDSAGIRAGFQTAPWPTAFGGCTAGAATEKDLLWFHLPVFLKAPPNRFKFNLLLNQWNKQRGKIKFKIPDGWIYPQNTSPSGVGIHNENNQQWIVTLSTNIRFSCDIDGSSRKFKRQ